MSNNGRAANKQPPRLALSRAVDVLKSSLGALRWSGASSRRVKEEAEGKKGQGGIVVVCHRELATLAPPWVLDRMQAVAVGTERWEEQMELVRRLGPHRKGYDGDARTGKGGGWRWRGDEGSRAGQEQVLTVRSTDI